MGSGGKIIAGVFSKFKIGSPAKPGNCSRRSITVANADATVDAKEFARVSKLGHTIEEVLLNKYGGMRKTRRAWRTIRFVIGTAGS